MEFLGLDRDITLCKLPLLFSNQSSIVNWQMQVNKCSTIHLLLWCNTIHTLINRLMCLSTLTYNSTGSLNNSNSSCHIFNLNTSIHHRWTSTLNNNKMQFSLASQDLVAEEAFLATVKETAFKIHQLNLLSNLYQSLQPKYFKRSRMIKWYLQNQHMVFKNLIKKNLTKKKPRKQIIWQNYKFRFEINKFKNKNKQN